MKRFLTYLFALLVLAPCTFALTACFGKSEAEARVMNVDLNPQVEFVLDTKDKVVTVNALNDEGNHIISIVAESDKTFEELTAEEAVELFLEVTKENGYLVADNGDISISISGDAEKLLKDVKSKAKSFLENANINIEIITEKLAKSELVNKVAECLKEYTSEDLEAMDEQELIELLKQSRKETKDLLTQELKDFYYSSRHAELQQARYEALQQAISEQSAIAGALTSTLNTAIELFNTKMAELKAAYEEYYLSEDSNYNQKMQKFITTKQTLLDARLKGTLTEAELETIEANVEAAETALANAKAAADAIINGINEAINSAINSINTALESLSTLMGNVNQDSINNAMNNAKNNFKEGFKDKYDDYMGDKSYWAPKNHKK